jgi:hypothetical protein
MRYYRLHDINSEYPDRWYLGSPASVDGAEVDPRTFTRGLRVECLGPLQIKVTREGTPQDFTLAEFGVPVLAQRFVDELLSIASDEIQVFPVSVADYCKEFSIVNVMKVIHCLDESRSDIAYWPANSGLPEMEGKYLTVSNIHLDARKLNGENIFRVGGWQSTIVVSESVGAVFADATGAVLERVPD